MNNDSGKVVGVIIALVIGLALLCLQTRSDEGRIREWAESNNCSVISIEKTYFDNGPFWFRDDYQRIYRVKVRDHLEHERRTYFRFGYFGYDQEWH